MNDATIICTAVPIATMAILHDAGHVTARDAAHAAALMAQLAEAGLNPVGPFGIVAIEEKAA